MQSTMLEQQQLEIEYVVVVVVVVVTVTVDILKLFWRGGDQHDLMS